MRSKIVLITSILISLVLGYSASSLINNKKNSQDLASYDVRKIEDLNNDIRNHVEEILILQENKQQLKEIIDSLTATIDELNNTISELKSQLNS